MDFSWKLVWSLVEFRSWHDRRFWVSRWILVERLGDIESLEFGGYLSWKALENRQHKRNRKLGSEESPKLKAPESWKARKHRKSWCLSYPSVRRLLKTGKAGRHRKLGVWGEFELEGSWKPDNFWDIDSLGLRGILVGRFLKTWRLRDAERPSK